MRQLLCRMGIHPLCPTWKQQNGPSDRYTLACRCPHRWCALHGRHGLLR